MRVHALAAALALLLSPAAFAQHDDTHSGHAVPGASVPGRADDMAAGGQQQEQEREQAEAEEAEAEAAADVDPHAGHHPSAQETPVDHTQMDHSQTDHAQGDHAQHGAVPPPPPAGEGRGGGRSPRTPIPPVTDADRAAASFVGGHAAHDDGTYTYVLFDRLEATDGDHGRSQAWEVQAWTGKDLDRLWLRSEGERVDGRTGAADIELLYGRAISPWWDLVAGVRHDFRPGEAQGHAAIGVIGMAPYKFEVEATAYLSEAGDLSARLEVEYDTLLTNRLVLQWLAEAELHGGDDPSRGVGSGLSTIEFGLRLRYEIRREFAPYVGIVRERAFGGTAGLRRGQGDPVDDTLVVAGVRIWF